MPIGPAGDGPVIPEQPDYWDVRMQLQAAKNLAAVWKTIAWVLGAAFVLAAALLLTACGGGTDQPGDAPAPTVDCKARPEVCR